MSDFDAEAERERLREKYDAEAENRKQTQEMSELLLKGATMTNRHCGECGSPIFRYEEQEFCPSCQRTTGEGAGAGSDTDGQSDTGPEGTAGGTAIEPEGQNDAERAGGETQATGGEPTVEERPTATSVATTDRGGSAPTRRAARESLLAALTRHARLAADTDEPRRATDHLEATREAAAALDELDGS